MTDKLFSALSLCRKAGALTMGFDAVKESVFKGKARLVLCAADASEGTRRRVKALCQDLETQYADLPQRQSELAAICKKPTAVFAVTQDGLADLCRKNLPGDAESKEERPCP